MSPCAQSALPCTTQTPSKMLQVCASKDGSTGCHVDSGPWRAVLIEHRTPDACQLLAGSCCAVLGVTPESRVIFCKANLFQSFLRSFFSPSPGGNSPAVLLWEKLLCQNFLNSCPWGHSMLEKQSFNSGVITSVLELGFFPPSHPALHWKLACSTQLQALCSKDERAAVCPAIVQCSSLL